MVSDPSRTLPPCRRPPTPPVAAPQERHWS